jgi:hypothetical protein
MHFPAGTRRRRGCSVFFEKRSANRAKIPGDIFADAEKNTSAFPAPAMRKIRV